MFDQNDSDMTAQLTKMKDAKVEFIIAYSLSPAAVQIAKSMQKIGLKVPWTGTWALIAPNFLKLGGKELIAGVMAVTSYTTDQSANAKALHEKMERVFKEQGGDFTRSPPRKPMMACASLLRALDKVGPDPQKIRDALEEIDDFTEAVTKMKPHPSVTPNHEFSVATPAFWRCGTTASLSAPPNNVPRVTAP